MNNKLIPITIEYKKLRKNHHIKFSTEISKEYKLQTIKLIKKLPIKITKIKDIVKNSWKDIFTIKDNEGLINIGNNTHPKPQIMGFFLEYLIAKKFEKLDKNMWKFDPTGYSKDIVNLKKPKLSIEIKSSSNPKRIYGNRSYSYKGKNNYRSKKSKNSFYLAINFEKFKIKNNLINKRPNLRLIRIGYLKQSDWDSQASQNGQASHIPKAIENVRLLEIYPKLDPILKQNCLNN